MQCDVAVIGSGAAGSVMAYELARRGIKVIVVERGAREDPQSFVHNELDMVPRLYKRGGLQVTKDNDMAILQGETVGGSTVINNAVWLRPDLDTVLPAWKEKRAEIDRGRLVEAFEDIEKNLHVSPIIPELVHRGTDVFLDGSRKLGIPARLLAHNRDECIACGWCNYGCRYNRKTSMLLTYIPWAEEKGTAVLDGCRGVTVTTNGGSVTGVKFERKGKPETVQANAVVVCAGAIGSSEVLLRSGIRAGGKVGSGFHLLGGVLVTAETEREYNSYDGIGLTAIADADPDVIIENFFAPPGAFAINLGGWFGMHADRMNRYTRFVQAGVMTATEPRGRITLNRKNETIIDIKFSKTELEKLKKGIRVLTDIFFAGGAVSVLPATYRYFEFTHPGDVDEILNRVRNPDDLLLGSAHPQGGNVMCDDPAVGVVDHSFRVHGFNNLYVADASIFPSNIRANCQAMVMGIAHVASDFVSS
jgi:choline dehydrogenase-like flavoprotein